MQVAISGQAGLALLWDGDQIHSLHTHAPGELIERQPGSLRFLLQGVHDLEVFDGLDLERAEAELQLASQRADGLHLALYLLDSTLSNGARSEVAEDLEVLLAEKGVADYVEGVLWSHPLPPDGDLPGANQIAAKYAPNALALIERFERDQLWIEKTWRAWQEIPDEVFGTAENRDETRALMVRRGYFPIVVECSSSQISPDELVYRLHSRPEARSIPNFSAIIDEWLARLDLPGSRDYFRRPQDSSESFVAEPTQPSIRPPRR